MSGDPTGRSPGEVEAPAKEASPEHFDSAGAVTAACATPRSLKRRLKSGCPVGTSQYAVLLMFGRRSSLRDSEAVEA